MNNANFFTDEKERSKTGQRIISSKTAFFMKKVNFFNKKVRKVIFH